MNSTTNAHIEVLISDSRMISRGSQFGHVAVDIDEKVYGRAPSDWDIDTKTNYLYRQQVAMNRDTVGFVLQISIPDKERLLKEILQRKQANKAYSLLNNSCSSNMVEVLGSIGIVASDPRWAIIPSPADMELALKRSKKLIKINVYPKNK